MITEEELVEKFKDAKCERCGRDVRYYKEEENKKRDDSICGASFEHQDNTRSYYNLCRPCSYQYSLILWAYDKGKANADHESMFKGFLKSKMWK